MARAIERVGLNAVLGDLEADVSSMISFDRQNAGGIAKDYFARNQRSCAAVSGDANIFKRAARVRKEFAELKSIPSALS